MCVKCLFQASVERFQFPGSGAVAPTTSDDGSLCESSERCPQVLPSSRSCRASHDEDEQDAASGGDFELAEKNLPASGAMWSYGIG